MKGRRRLRKSVEGLDLQKSNKDRVYTGLLGTILNGQEQVEVIGRDNFVYVRLRDNQSELVQAFNRSVAPVFNFPVLVRRKEKTPNLYEVIDVDVERYMGNFGSTAPLVPKHAPQHMFNPDAPGGDIVWVYGRQLVPLLAHPSGSFGACNVVIEPYHYYQDGVWKYGGGTGTADICMLKPTDNTAKMVLLYLDSNTNPQLVVGPSFNANLTGTVDILPFVPALPDTSALPIAWIRLVSGTTSILWQNIYDARPWMVADGVMSTGTNRHIIQDEGSNLPDQPYLDFVGNLVTVTNSGSKTIVTITGSLGGHVIQDEGIATAPRPILNFVGSEVWLADDSGGNRTNVIISGSASQGFATLSEAQQGDIPHKMISPFTLPIWVRNGAMIRRDGTGAQGNSRGDGAVELQRDRYAPEQVASGPYASIGGGIGNRNNSEVSAIGGGELNTILGSGDWMTIAGGFNNLISGSASGAAIVGGQSNSIGGSASNASIIGGSSNNVTATNGIASGNNAHAFLPYMEARAVGQTGTGRQQRVQLIWSRSTTNATPAEAMIAAVNRAVLQNYSTWLFEIWVVGHNTTTPGEGAGYKFTGVINRQATAASTALIGSVTKVEVAESVAAWDANVDADTTNGSLRIMVTGEAGETIYWLAHGIITHAGG